MIDISTRALRAMIALGELGNFSLAAERCHVTQSALSQLVRKLELDVGLQLVDRDRRHARLTAEGQRFVATARRVMQELGEIELDLKEHATARKGRISFAALASLAAHWLPQVVAEYKRKFPDIELSMFDVSPPEALELIRSRQADFGVTAQGPGRTGVQSRLLFNEGFMVVCHKSHPLAAARHLTLADLNGHTYIRFARSGSLAQYLETSLRTAHLVDSGMEVNQLPTVAGLVGSNLGISVVPELTVPYFDQNAVATIPLLAPNLQRPIYLVHASGKQLSKPAEMFIQLMQATTLKSWHRQFK
jgi:LysR family transcriptional regulator, carnitine catabolism transcriptional activator